MLLSNENNLLAVSPVVSLTSKTFFRGFRAFTRLIYKFATPTFKENVGGANCSVGASRGVIPVDYCHS